MKINYDALYLMILILALTLLVIFDNGSDLSFLAIVLAIVWIEKLLYPKDGGDK